MSERNNHDTMPAATEQREVGPSREALEAAAQYIADAWNELRPELHHRVVHPEDQLAPGETRVPLTRPTGGSRGPGGRSQRSRGAPRP